MVTPNPVFINPFTDVFESDYYYNPVKWAVLGGITSGTGEHSFSPNQSCTRAQIVTFLWKAMGSSAPSETYNPFEDVSSADYYYSAVLWAVERGITAGASPTSFAPDDECTREQAVMFLWNAAGRPVASNGAVAFYDVAPNDYYYEAVNWAVGKGITAGIGEGLFGSGYSCSRGQIVTFLYHLFA